MTDDDRHIFVRSLWQPHFQTEAHLSVGKAVCAIAAIHWQQQALGEDLTSIGSVLPLLQTFGIQNFEIKKSWGMGEDQGNTESPHQIRIVRLTGRFL